jgi:hypothetical protein
LPQVGGQSPADELHDLEPERTARLGGGEHDEPLPVHRPGRVVASTFGSVLDLCSLCFRSENRPPPAGGVRTLINATCTGAAACTLGGAAWADASTGVVHAFHPGFWGNNMLK